MEDCSTSKSDFNNRHLPNSSTAGTSYSYSLGLHRTLVVANFHQAKGVSWREAWVQVVKLSFPMLKIFHKPHEVPSGALPCFSYFWSKFGSSLSNCCREQSRGTEWIGRYLWWTLRSIGERTQGGALENKVSKRVTSFTETYFVLISHDELDKKLVRVDKDNVGDQENRVFIWIRYIRSFIQFIYLMRRYFSTLFWGLKVPLFFCPVLT